jgi:two-component system sensor histidine kinase/response regulator
VRVLVVDDHLSNRKLLRIQLEAEGNVVLEAANGCDALAVLGGDPVDAVISDILMPVMDGYRLCHEIRKSGSAVAGVPLILYTATFNSQTDRQLAATVGADCYLLKPATTPAILAALGEAQLKARHRSQTSYQRTDDFNVLELYNSALVRKLEARNGELQQALAEVRSAHERIQELNQNLETRVGQRTAALNSENQDLATLSHSVAHDLRAPLLNMTGFADLLTETAGKHLDAECREYLNQIIGGSRRMHQIIDALTEYSRVGTAPLSLIDVDLNEILNAALTPIRHETQDRNIQWQLQRLPHGKGDPHLLQQVFSYLIDNAVKYTRVCNPAVIDIGYRRGRADEQVICVRDNGIGFDMQHAGTLFGVFRRLAGTESFEGTGISLASARRIVTRHGGRIWAEAELGRGATFCFSLLAPETG